jgi:MscS family membrane protein
LANRTIMNIGKRPYIRRVMNVRLAYDLSPEKVDRALEILRDILSAHEGMSEERPPRVFLDDFLDSAINLRAFYWFHPPDFWEFTRCGEDINLQLLTRFKEEGIRFALPSQRLFVSGDLENPMPGGLGQP